MICFLKSDCLPVTLEPYNKRTQAKAIRISSCLSEVTAGHKRVLMILAEAEFDSRKSRGYPGGGEPGYKEDI